MSAKHHREAGGDSFSCAAQFTLLHCNAVGTWNPTGPPEGSDGYVCSLHTSPASASCSMTDTFMNSFEYIDVGSQTQYPPCIVFTSRSLTHARIGISNRN